MEFATIIDFLHSHKPHFVHKKVKISYVIAMWCLIYMQFYLQKHLYDTEVKGHYGTKVITFFSLLSP